MRSTKGHADKFRPRSRDVTRVSVTQRSDQGHTDIEVHNTSAVFLYPEYSATPVCSVLRTVTPEHFDSLGGGTLTTQVQKYKTYNNVPL